MPKVIAEAEPRLVLESPDSQCGVILLIIIPRDDLPTPMIFRIF